MPKHVFEKFSNTLRGNKRFWTSQNDEKHKKRRKRFSRSSLSRTRSVNSVEASRLTRLRSFARRITGFETTSTVLGSILIIAGIVWFVFLYKAPVVQTQTSDFVKEPIIADKAFEEESEESDIRSIVIPRLNIDLSVAPSRIKNGYWEVSEISASHGEGSANPGQGGNVVVFAHAREGLFLELRDVKKGDTVYVLTANRWYKYKVSEIVNVYPNDIKTVAPTDSEILTLFTCSGFFDEKRLIVKAIPEKDIFW